jgi:hypothetical protein
MASFPMHRKTGSAIRKKVRRESGVSIGKTDRKYHAKTTGEKPYHTKTGGAPCQRAMTSRDCPKGHHYR